MSILSMFASAKQFAEAQKSEIGQKVMSAAAKSGGDSSFMKNMVFKLIRDSVEKALNITDLQKVTFHIIYENDTYQVFATTNTMEKKSDIKKRAGSQLATMANNHLVEKFKEMGMPIDNMIQSFITADLSQNNQSLTARIFYNDNGEKCDTTLTIF